MPLVRARLSSAEFADAAVLGALAAVLVAVGTLLPHIGAVEWFAILPFGLLGTQPRLRAVVCGAIAGGTIAVLIAGLGAGTQVVGLAAVGGFAGWVIRRGRGVGTVLAGGLVGGLLVGAVGDGALLVLVAARNLAFASVRGVADGVATAVLAVPVLSSVGALPAEITRAVLGSWWVWVPVAALVGVTAGMVLVWIVLRDLLARLPQQHRATLGLLGPIEGPAHPLPVVLRHAWLGGARTDGAGLDLTIRHGEFLVVTGANGAGKSTLLQLLAGTPAASGSVERSGGAGPRRGGRHRAAPAAPGDPGARYDGRGGPAVGAPAGARHRCAGAARRGRTGRDRGPADGRALRRPAAAARARGFARAGAGAPPVRRVDGDDRRGRPARAPRPARLAAEEARHDRRARLALPRRSAARRPADRPRRRPHRARRRPAHPRSPGEPVPGGAGPVPSTRSCCRPTTSVSCGLLARPGSTSCCATPTSSCGQGVGCGSRERTGAGSRRSRACSPVWSGPRPGAASSTASGRTARSGGSASSSSTPGSRCSARRSARTSLRPRASRRGGMRRTRSPRRGSRPSRSIRPSRRRGWTS